MTPLLEPMETIHEPLDVPAVEAIPALGSQGRVEHRINLFAEGVLTLALRGAPSIVEAEQDLLDDTPIAWTSRSRPGPSRRRIIAICPRYLFRSVLAYFNHNYLEDQLYGGCIRRTLRQEGRSIVTVIHSGNEGVSGLWIRIATGVPLGESRHP